MRISIIIATRNRERKLNACLRSILLCKFSNYEIIVIDQSSNNRTPALMNTLKNVRIKYISQQSKGKARALNRGLLEASGDIVAFTDDDCIVDRNWIATIHRSFTNRQVSGVFGKTLPYEPHKHTNSICPCTFVKKAKSYYQSPTYHATNIGFGNNMAFRASVFKNVGRFNTLFGPGSIGSNAEDAEFVLRVLSKGLLVAYNPLVMIRHNKWLTIQQMFQQSLSYTCGEVACYTYYALQGYPFARNIIFSNIRAAIYDHGITTAYIIRGLCVGVYAFIQYRFNNYQIQFKNNMSKLNN